jgi:hypothetical protein
MKQILVFFALFTFAMTSHSSVCKPLFSLEEVAEFNHAWRFEEFLTGQQKAVFRAKLGFNDITGVEFLERGEQSMLFQRKRIDLIVVYNYEWIRIFDTAKSFENHMWFQEVFFPLLKPIADLSVVKTNKSDKNNFYTESTGPDGVRLDRVFSEEVGPRNLKLLILRALDDKLVTLKEQIRSLPGVQKVEIGINTNPSAYVSRGQSWGQIPALRLKFEFEGRQVELNITAFNIYVSLNNLGKPVFHITDFQ